MQYLKQPLLFVLMGLCIATGALAEGDTQTTLSVEGRAVNLVLPEGMCVYDPNQLFDAQILASLQGNATNADQLLLAFNDCKDLALLRTGKPAAAGYSGQILAPFSMQGMVDGFSRADVVKKVSDVNKRTGIWKENGPTIAQKLQFAREHKLAVGGVRNLGILKSEPDYVMVATLQYRPVAGPLPEPVLGVNVTTKLGVPVVVSLYHAGESDDVLAGLSDYSEQYVRELISLNTDEVVVILRKRILGVVLLLLMAAGLYLWYRRGKAK